jgi:glycerate-2-kinase
MRCVQHEGRAEGGAPHPDRQLAEVLFRRGLAAADPRSATLRALSDVAPKDDERLVVVACGKAAPAMALAAAERFGPRLREGLVVTTDDPAAAASAAASEAAREAAPLPLLCGGHPLPDARGLEAARRIQGLARRADETTLFIVLLSGGASSLLSLPAEGLQLEDLRGATDVLLRSGADIREVNALRKHVGALAGGRLAALAFPARVVTLAVSDVVGDPVDVIGSAPTSADPSTFADALRVVDERGLAGRLPPRVLAHLRAGAAGERPETPKPGAPTLRGVVPRIVLRNEDVLDAVAEAAGDAGLAVERAGSAIEGEAREVGPALVARARAIRARPACLIGGGETTVTLAEAGRGGRNTELVLAAVLSLGQGGGVTVLSAGTDGRDGTSGAAGAVGDAGTLAAARAEGLDAAAFLEGHDAASFFERAGGLIVTGPTGTNVMDVQLAIVR